MMIDFRAPNCMPEPLEAAHRFEPETLATQRSCRRIPCRRIVELVVVSTLRVRLCSTDLSEGGGRMRKLAVAAVASALGGCAYSTGPASDGRVGGTGGVTFQHEEVARGRHLLVVNASPGVGETESSIAQRILVAANRFAGERCPEGFSFVDDPNSHQPTSGGFMRRSRTYTFTCP